MKNFRTYQIAVEFYHLSAEEKLPGHLRDQLRRAASSVVLNLAEGSGRFSAKDQKRFFHIAFGSLRECQAVFDLNKIGNPALIECADKLAAHLFKLIDSG
jgi:four helix bundle protein